MLNFEVQDGLYRALQTQTRCCHVVDTKFKLALNMLSIVGNNGTASVNLILRVNKFPWTLKTTL